MRPLSDPFEDANGSWEDGDPDRARGGVGLRLTLVLALAGLLAFAFPIAEGLVESWFRAQAISVFWSLGLVVFAPLGLLAGAGVGLSAILFNLYVTSRLQNELIARSLSAVFGTSIFLAVTWWWWTSFISLDSDAIWVAWIEFIGIGMVSGVALWVMPGHGWLSVASRQRRGLWSDRANAWPSDRGTPMDPPRAVGSPGDAGAGGDARANRRHEVLLGHCLRNELLALITTASILGIVQGALFALFKFATSTPPFGQGGGWGYAALIAALTSLGGVICGAVAGALVGVVAVISGCLIGRQESGTCRSQGLALLPGISLATAGVSIAVCGVYSWQTLAVFVAVSLTDWLSLSILSKLRFRRLVAS